MPRRIDKLSPEQEELIPIVRDEWLRIGLSTEPAERQVAERAVAEAYAIAGLQPPAIRVWLASPLAGCIGAAMMASLRGVPGDQAMDQVRDQVWGQVRDQVGNQVRDQVWGQVLGQVGDQVRGQVGNQVRDQVWDQVLGQVGDQVGDQVWDQVRDQVRDQVWDQVRDQVRSLAMNQVWGQVGDQVRDQVRDQVWGQVWDQVRGQVGDQVGDQVRDQVYRCGYGQHDAAWLAWCEFFGGCGVDTARISGLANIARSCGWWWPFRSAVVLTGRPIRLERDNQFRLHSAAGMAIEYADGWGIFAWHGVRVPEQVIRAPEMLTARQITNEPNAEVRRVMLERFGAARYLRELGAEPISIEHVPCGDAEWCSHTAEHHQVKLYRADLRDDEPLVIVEVVNSTPEPDGEWKHYFLRVPPTVRSAREAVAWTAGYDRAEDYAPVRQT